MLTEQYLISDMLDKLGLKLMANHVLREANRNLIRAYLPLIEQEATRKKNSRVLDQLWAAKMIHG